MIHQFPFYVVYLCHNHNLNVRQYKSGHFGAISVRPKIMYQMYKGKDLSKFMIKIECKPLEICSQPNKLDYQFTMSENIM